MNELLGFWLPLAALLSPALALALLNFVLAFAGERGTLLLPSGILRHRRREAPAAA